MAKVNVELIRRIDVICFSYNIIEEHPERQDTASIYLHSWVLTCSRDSPLESVNYITEIKPNVGAAAASSVEAQFSARGSFLIMKAIRIASPRFWGCPYTPASRSRPGPLELDYDECLRVVRIDGFRHVRITNSWNLEL